MWFAFKLVSLNHWIQRHYGQSIFAQVVICFQISIFEPLNTARSVAEICLSRLWFAFKLVSLNHWIQQKVFIPSSISVVICFQISIFEPLNTAPASDRRWRCALWFAFKLVSLNHWIQPASLSSVPSFCCDLLSN